MSGFFNPLNIFFRRQEMLNPKTEKLLEVNLGCFGGFDSQAMYKCWKSAYDTFLEYLKQQGNNKHKIVKDFWQFLASVEVPESQFLFNCSINNLGRVFAEQLDAMSLPKTKFLLISVSDDFEKKGEENYFLVEEMKTRVGKENVTGISLYNFLSELKEEKDLEGHLDILKNIFMFDDFTDEELEVEINKSIRAEQYKNKGITLQWAKDKLKLIKSLYPRELEMAAGRDFAKNLRQNNNNSKLLVEPIYSQNVLIYEHKNTKNGQNILKVEIYDGEKLVNLTDKVLKIDGTSSGEGIYFYHKNAHIINTELKDKSKVKCFNEFTFKETVGVKKYTIEDFVHGPKMFIPYNLKDNGYGKMTEYVVDVRFGYYFDPKNPDEIQVISSYGRFNYPGKKSNIAQGGGVVDIKVVQDDKYQESKMKMLETVFSLEKQDGQFFQDRLSENLQNDNLTYKGKSMAMSPLPFIISESAFERMKAAALQVAKNLKSDKPFMFALDAFLNPSPIEYTNST